MEITENQVLEICEKIKVEFVNFKFLSRGNHNESYLIQTNKEKLVLRIENNNQFKNLKNEYKFLKQIDGKFAPKVFLFDNSHNIISKDYLIEEFIEGEHPERKVDNNFVKLIALWYKKLHSNRNKISLKDRKEKNLYSQFKNYDANIRKYKKEVSLEIWKEYEFIIEQVKVLFNKYVHLLDKRKYFSMVHGDPTRSNVFYDKKSIKLIDWEFVRYDYPEADLTFFLNSYDLTQKQWNLFLKVYGYSDSKIMRQILDMFFIRHYIGMINWRFERLHFISIGKADLNQSSSNKNKMVKEIENDLYKIKEILNLK